MPDFAPGFGPLDVVGRVNLVGALLFIVQPTCPQGLMCPDTNRIVLTAVFELQESKGKHCVYQITQ